MEVKRAKTGRKWAKDCHLLIFEIACFNSLSVQLRLVLRELKEATGKAKTDKKLDKDGHCSQLEGCMIQISIRFVEVPIECCLNHGEKQRCPRNRPEMTIWNSKVASFKVGMRRTQIGTLI